MVRTFAIVRAIVRFRNRPHCLLLDELGAYLLDPANAAQKGEDGLLPLTVPEVPRLLVALAEPRQCFSFRLAWSKLRRHHQAVAEVCHTTRRARSLIDGVGTLKLPVLRTLNLELPVEDWGPIYPLLPPETSHQPAHARPSQDPRWHPEGGGNRHRLAGPSREVRFLANGLRAISSLDR